MKNKLAERYSNLWNPSPSPLPGGERVKVRGALGFLTAILILTAIPYPAQADEAQLMSMMQDMQRQMSQMQKTMDRQSDKIRDLEGRQPSMQVAAPSTGETTPPMSDYEFNERLAGALGGANKWLKDLSFKGDLRLRYEAFDNHTGNVNDSADRNRFRFRLRYGFEKKFSEQMKVGFAMASGESAAGVQVDPTSTNTTFDNLFNYKDIFIEKAFASYTPDWAKVGAIEKFNVTAGKLDNPFEKGSTDMVWDRDVKPEGVYEKVDIKLLDSEELDLSSFLTAGQFILDEENAPTGDAELFAQQLGLNAVAYTPFLERPLDLTSAFSWYSFRNYAQGNSFAIGGSSSTGAANGTSLARGNTNVLGLANELDAGDFEILEVYNEIAFYPLGLPIRPFFDWAINADNGNNDGAIGGIGTDEDSAWSFGTKIGGITKKGDWELGYAYKRIAANSLVGAFNDSDFGTNAHSGARGSVFKAGYALTDSLMLNGAAIFVNNLNTDTGPLTAGATSGRNMDEDQRRFQLDLLWKF